MILNLIRWICIETGASQNMDNGCVGTFFAKLCDLNDGEFYSVDNDENIIKQSKTIYKKHNLKVKLIYKWIL